MADLGHIRALLQSISAQSAGLQHDADFLNNANEAVVRELTDMEFTLEVLKNIGARKPHD